MEKKKWYEQRTTWMAILMIATVALPLLGDKITPAVVEGARTIIVGLALIFGRVAIENTKGGT
jgi:hypothetical protein